MATFHPYLFFGGNCRAAFTRYAEIFGGESFMMRMGDAPDQSGVPADKQDYIIHAALKFENGSLLMGSDDPMTESFGPVQGMQVSYSAPDAGDAARVFDALARGGNAGAAAHRDLLLARVRHGDRRVRHAVDDRGRPRRGNRLINSSPTGIHLRCGLVVRFSDDDGFDFAIRCLLNGVPYGLADPGELLAATGDVAAGDADGWFDALTDLGARLEDEADTARGAADTT